MKKRGISLITLVITIVVLIILSAVIILNLGTNNPINQARLANVAQTRDSINSAVSTYLAKVKADTFGEYGTYEVLTGSISSSAKYKITSDDTAIIKENNAYKILYKLDSEKAKSNLNVELKEIDNKSSWYVDKNGKVYLIYNTMREVTSYLKEGDNILPSVSGFVAYKDENDELVLEITSNKGTLTNSEEITYTFTFNNSVKEFDINDIEVQNGTKGTFNKVSENEYSLVVRNSGSCIQTVTVPNGVCKDAIRDIENIGNNIEVTIDRKGPELTSLEVTSPTTGTYISGTKLTIVATYDEDIYNLARQKISEDKLSAPNLILKFGEHEEKVASIKSASDRTAIYEYEMQADDEGDLIISKYQGKLYDNLGNPGEINRTGNFDGNVITGKIRSNGSISYANLEVTKAPGDAIFMNPLTHEGDGTVTYSSSNTEVATIDSLGNVTLGTTLGQTTITATVEDTLNYKYEVNTATYTIILAKKNGSISYATTEVSRMLGSGTYTNSLTKVGNGTVSYSSSDTTIATVNSNGAVTLKKKTGTVTITATVTDTETYEYEVKTASYTLTATAHVHSSSCRSYHYHSSSCKAIYHSHTDSCYTNCPMIHDSTNPSDIINHYVKVKCPKCGTTNEDIVVTTTCDDCGARIVRYYCYSCHYDRLKDPDYHNKSLTCGKTTSTIDGYRCGYSDGEFIGYNCGF